MRYHHHPPAAQAANARSGVSPWQTTCRASGPRTIQNVYCCIDVPLARGPAAAGPGVVGSGKPPCLHQFLQRRQMLALTATIGVVRASAGRPVAEADVVDLAVVLREPVEAAAALHHVSIRRHNAVLLLPDD